MGKALMIGLRSQSGNGMASGQESPLMGTNGFGSSEAANQVSATEACTISKMKGHIFSGGESSNTFRLRKNAADGNLVLSRTGTGAMSDDSNSDSLSAGDLFNMQCTETSTADPILSWVTANVEFASGHGNFHGSCNGFGTVCDLNSTTRYFGLAGNHSTDGEAAESSSIWRNRAYTSWEALQVSVTSNARTSTTTFKNRIASGDGGLVCDFATLTTGLVVDTSPADSLSDGNDIAVSMTLGAGAGEAISVLHICGTFKSTTGKSQVWAGNAGAGRTASATGSPYTPGGAIKLMPSPGDTETVVRITPGFAARISNLAINIEANTYTGNSFIRLVKNGSVSFSQQINSGQTGIVENTTDTVDINDTDTVSLEIDEGTSGSITTTGMGFTFSPLVVPYPQLERGTRGLTRGLAPMWR